MLFKALRNAIERSAVYILGVVKCIYVHVYTCVWSFFIVANRSLVEKGFYPLGQWFAKPDVDSLEWFVSVVYEHFGICYSYLLFLHDTGLVLCASFHCFFMLMKLFVQVLISKHWVMLPHWLLTCFQKLWSPSLDWKVCAQCFLKDKLQTVCLIYNFQLHVNCDCLLINLETTL
jgi:hypothetical protein